MLVHPSHPLSKAREVTLSECARQTVIAHNDPSHVRDRVLRTFEQHHIPTNIVVQCQNERSQLQNRNGAMKILKARLYEVEQKKKEAEFNAIVGEKKDISWGSQIRAYVFQP